MKRPINRRAAAGGARVRHRLESARLDPIALEAIERFTRVLAHCGGSPRDLAAAFEAACHRIPPAAAVGAEGATPEMSDASHVLTIWYSDPEYTNPDGVPTAVPLRGTAPSVEALIRRVDPKLKVDVVLRYLLHVAALRKKGRRYTPRSRLLALRGTGGPTNFRNLRGLTAMLRTLEHNGRPKRMARGWFEVFAENPRFPAKARAAFDTRLDRLGMEFLQSIDADMHRRELARKAGEPTVRIGVGVYRFEDEAQGETAVEARNSERPARRRTAKRRQSK